MPRSASIVRAPPTGNAPSAKALLLRGNSLFGALPEPILQRISAYFRRRSVAKGSVIFRKGDAGVGLVGVVSGSVKISVTSPEGRDVVLNILHEGEVFGEIALLDGRPRTADAVAMSDCDLIIIERREFLPFLRTNPEVTLKLMEILCARLRNTSEQVADVTFLSLEARLAKTLLRLAGGDGAATSKGRIAITQREISQIVGKSRESANKQLRAWAKRGWLRLERRGITVLKPEKLAQVAAAGLEET
jgi:CRP-like cAMP-binding protein